MPRINPTLPADGDDAIVEPYNAAITAILGVLNGSIDADNVADGSITLAKLATAVQGALVPTGLISPFGGTSAPTGWLLCDGTSYLRGSYSSLFATIGTAYGSADGTHFNVPDLRGRVPVGNDGMGGTNANRIQHTTTITTTSGSATATVGSNSGLAVGQVINSANVPAGTTITAMNIDDTTITMSANATANGSAVAARFSLIGNDAAALGSVGGTDVHTLVGAQLPGKNLYIEVSGNGFTGNLAFPGAGSNMGGNFGNGPQTDPHPNMQPSLVVNYIIKT